MANGQDKKYTKKSYSDEQGIYHEKNVDTGEMMAGSNIDMDDVPIVDPDDVKVANITHPSGRKFQFTKEQADSLLAGEYNAKDLERFEVQPEEAERQASTAQPDPMDEMKREASMIVGLNFKGFTHLRAISPAFQLIPYSPSVIAKKLMGDKQ
tara:strand:+ start:4153 stop:4611 length:459 start_codon:yes stop_codon:yes gene_type:complete